MQAKTHLAADPRLCGQPLELGPGTARVALDTNDSMAVDEHGLIHGGFLFGAADYAAMLAVNDPHVVLAGAEARFLKPVRKGEQIVATAHTVEQSGKKHQVLVEAHVGAAKVFEGKFTCIVLERHVLEPVGSE